MEYCPFNCTRIGATHVRLGLPCQDASALASVGPWLVAVVADGHGNARHFRSGRGAELACSVTLAAVERLLADGEAAVGSMDVWLQRLKQDICRSWRDRVRADFLQNPWTQEELAQAAKLLEADAYEALEDGTDAPIAYGSTVCAILVGPDGWAAVQLGDGAMVHIAEDGSYSWPMPQSALNEGHRTASLCLRDPLYDFRHCYGQDHPAGLLVCTDGVDKALPPQGEQIVSFLHWVWNDARKNLPSAPDAPFTDGLRRTLDMLTERSRIGDDVSIAGVVDVTARDHEPHLSDEERARKRARQQSAAAEQRAVRVRELAGTLDFAKRQLVRLRLQKFSLFGDPDGQRRIADDIASAEAVVARCTDELYQLQADEVAAV